MRRTVFRLLSCASCALFAGSSWAVDPWQNALIMPKTEQVVIRDGRAVVGDVYEVQWPALVERIEGQWLRITDRGGYRIPTVHGWVSKEEMVKLDAAPEQYRKTLRTENAPWVHWLLGICLEANRDWDVADLEYGTCLGAAPGATPGMPCQRDAALRRLALRINLAQNAEEVRSAAAEIAALAQTSGDGVGQAHLNFVYAEALHRAYHLVAMAANRVWEAGKRTAAPAESPAETRAFQDADAAFAFATSPSNTQEHLGPHWWMCHYAWGRLYLDRGQLLRERAYVQLVPQEARLGLRASDALPELVAQQADQTLSYGEMPEDDDTQILPSGLQELDRVVRRLNPSANHAAGKPSDRPERTSAPPVEPAQKALAREMYATASHCLDGALEQFTAALAVNSDLADAHRDRAIAYYDLAQCEAATIAIDDASGPAPATQTTAQPLPGNLDRSFLDGRKDYRLAAKRMRAAKENQTLILALKKDLTTLEDGIAKRIVGEVTPGGGGKGADKAAADRAAQPAAADVGPRTEGKRPGGAGRAGNAAATTVEFTTSLRAFEDFRRKAAEATKEIAKREAYTSHDLALASNQLAQTNALLLRNRYLQQARQSAESACAKSNYSDAECLKALAEIHAAQGNFDRAEFYQKQAVIYTSDDARAQTLQTLDNYRSMNELTGGRAKPLTQASAGQAKGGPSGGAADDSSGGKGG